MNTRIAAMGVFLLALGGGAVLFLLAGGGGGGAHDVSTSVEAAEITAIDDQYRVAATVTNHGNAAYENPVRLRVNGETVASKSVTVRAESSNTVVFTHSFDSPDSYAVGIDAGEGEPQTWVVDVQSITEHTAEHMTNLSTVTMSQSITAEFEYTENRTPVRHAEIITEGTYDFENETMHERIEEYIYSDGAGDSEITEDRWYVDEMLYFRSVINENNTEYETYDGEFSEVEISSTQSIAEYVRSLSDEQLERDDGMYRYHANLTDIDQIERSLGAAGGVNVFPSGAVVNSATVEIQIDAERHTVQSVTITVNAPGDEPDADVAGSMTLTLEYFEYGNPVSVSLPDGDW